MGQVNGDTALQESHLFSFLSHVTVSCCPRLHERYSYTFGIQHALLMAPAIQEMFLMKGVHNGDSK